MGTSSTTDEPSHQVSHDIEKLAKAVKDELEISHAFSDICCIYKVPEPLREVNEKAYTPRMVSIGPIHHGKEKLKAMEDHKRMYLKEFIARSEASVEGFIELIKEKETRLRNCYAETNGFSSEYFIRMILMDAAFVIMFLLKSTFADLSESRDSIFHPPYKKIHVRLEGIINLYRNVIEMKKSKEYIGRRTENQTVSIEAEDEFLHCCIFAFA
nr:UPF0481 protein At3g47200-like [Populus alba]